MMMKAAPKGLDKLILILGILTLVYTAFMGAKFPQEAALSAGFKTPIIAFEFAKTEADIAFLAGDSALAKVNRAKMDNGNLYDLAYPFFYGVLMALMLVQLARGGLRIAWLGVAFAVLIIPTDIRENLLLLDITAALATGGTAADLLPSLHGVTWMKWGVIGLAQAVAAFCFVQARHWVGAAIAGLGAAIMAATYFTGDEPTLAELAGPGLGLLLLYATIKAGLNLRRR